MNTKTFRTITAILFIIMALFMVGFMVFPETSIAHPIMGYSSVIIYAFYFSYLLRMGFSH